MDQRQTIRDFRILLESTIEAIKGRTLSSKVAIHFGLEIPPTSALNDSEALSYLDKMVRAIRQFPEETLIGMDLSVRLLHEEQKELLEDVKRRVEAVRGLSLSEDIKKP